MRCVAFSHLPPDIPLLHGLSMPGVMLAQEVQEMNTIHSTLTEHPGIIRAVLWLMFLTAVQGSEAAQRRE